MKKSSWTRKVACTGPLVMISVIMSSSLNPVVPFSERTLPVGQPVGRGHLEDGAVLRGVRGTRHPVARLVGALRDPAQPGLLGPARLVGVAVLGDHSAISRTSGGGRLTPACGCTTRPCPGSRPRSPSVCAGCRRAAAVGPGWHSPVRR